jgi:hypothetical protein
MKDKIKALIDRQLGPLPEEIKEDDYLNYHNLYFDTGIQEYLEKGGVEPLQTFLVLNPFAKPCVQAFLNQEQSRRELLAELIESTTNEFSFFFNEGWIGIFTWDDEKDLRRQEEIAYQQAKEKIDGRIKLIEKSLSVNTPITWDEIVKYLED